MSCDDRRLDELQGEALVDRLSRRQVLRRGLGLGAAAATGLLVGCGDDDADTTDEQAASTETTVADSTPTGAAEKDEATSTAVAAGATATEPAAGVQTFQGGDRLMGKPIEEAGSTGGVVIVGSIADISTFNPILNTDSVSGLIIAMIFESLVEAHPDALVPVGLLAESWSVTEDGLEWTFNLRQNVIWQDGEPFTAEDVKFTFDTFMTEEVSSPRFADMTGTIRSVEVVDAHTVKFNANHVHPDFPLALCNHGIIPKHLWEGVAPADIHADPGSTGEDPARVVGTGPFRFQEWLVEDRVTLVKNENYWDGTPHLDQFILKYVADQDTLIQQLRAGEIDWTAVPESAVSGFEGSDVMIFTFPTLSFTCYGTNLDVTRTALFQQAEVRRALLYALDREAMIEAIRFGYGEVAVGTFPVLSWANNPDDIEEELRYAYDPDKARDLLGSAGWVEGSGGIREKNGQRLSFTMHVATGNTVYEQYLTIMQEQWREIGVEMTPQLEPFPSLVERLSETFDFEAFLTGFGWGVPPDQSSMWACDSYPLGFNVVKYCNERVDQLLDEALAELDRERRVEIYTEFQNVLLRDLPVVVLDFPEGVHGLHSRVHNLFPNDVNFLYNPETWWVDS